MGRYMRVAPENVGASRKNEKTTVARVQRSRQRPETRPLDPVRAVSFPILLSAEKMMADGRVERRICYTGKKNINADESSASATERTHAFRSSP
jgi:hypothetical protein